MALVNLVAVGVILGVVFGDQSESNSQSLEQIEDGDGKRRIDAPAVVLQLKYDRGELNRIYLAQFRKGNGVWAPSVTVRHNLCSDLCHAGLGGAACGSSCEDLMPVGLKSALKEANHTDGDYGEPRFEVCPALCDNMLGSPLCNCQVKDTQEEEVNWSAICAAFCVADNYVLRGCPPCEKTTTKPTLKISSFRALNTAEGWSAWCNVQCRQGHGGAACNCDRAPI
ncbi:hypothetical protein ABMA28_011036 [Loxostege sticticalis]|uniref:Uncharacterized protein n=1 Tax=Loxostege sticticalis TaxID=481309 RepID=A0ABD0S874_LOXSC